MPRLRPFPLPALSRVRGRVPACGPSLALLCLALVLALCGCAQKTVLPGYGPDPARRAVQEQPGPDSASLPQGWGLVDVDCFEGVGRERGQLDTLFGCLLYARDSGRGVVRLPRGVYLGHVAEFIVKALKFYHIQSHFERFYGYRVVLVFRPASPEEVAGRTGPGWSRLGAGVAGEAVLTLFGAPLVPLVAPVVFAFEAVDADMEFQRFKRDALARGLPEPTRRGDEITSDAYKERYEAYWQAVNGEQAAPGMEALYVVERCYLAHPRGGRLRLAKKPEPRAAATR